MSDFILDIEQIRKAARDQMEKGAVTANYQADRNAILKILDSALATEWICVLRYTQHAKSAQGLHAEPIARHFFEHAQQEEGHANELADRIKQLGGKPDLDPDSFRRRAHTQYTECNSLVDMIKENLIAERIAVDAYSAAIRFIGPSDPTTRRILESILAVEEEHADELADLLAAFDPRENLN
ncbi:ferritin-like domain-containing protein [Oligoflexus tunisiensis]|uniref:ferritin-like domain-containing protein n=1 Tax=Oligoflexus tunisiensis TaxID=708132 RepID=UPI000A7DFF99|nr:ferritin-like domain-containing protein [Oligoflexus tunisiensis]